MYTIFNPFFFFFYITGLQADVPPFRTFSFLFFSIFQIDYLLSDASSFFSFCLP